MDEEIEGKYKIIEDIKKSIKKIIEDIIIEHIKYKINFDVE